MNDFIKRFQEQGLNMLILSIRNAFTDLSFEVMKS